MKPRTSHISRLIKDTIKSVDSKADVILYGSRARGDERKSSDWDILVLVDETVGVMTERRFREKIYDLELETGESFSLFVYSKKEWNTKHRISPFYHNVTQEGIQL